MNRISLVSTHLRSHERLQMIKPMGTDQVRISVRHHLRACWMAVPFPSSRARRGGRAKNRARDGSDKSKRRGR